MLPTLWKTNLSVGIGTAGGGSGSVSTSLREGVERPAARRYLRS
jgi:hypothetical protein